MAKEILVIDRELVLFFGYYDPAPVVIGGEPQVLRQPSNELPPIASGFLDPTELAAIDNGLVSWEPQRIERGKDETVPELVARTKKKWALWKKQEDRRVGRWAEQIANVRWIDVRRAP